MVISFDSSFKQTTKLFWLPAGCCVGLSMCMCVFVFVRVCVGGCLWADKESFGVAVGCSEEDFFFQIWMNLFPFCQRVLKSMSNFKARVRQLRAAVSCFQEWDERTHTYRTDIHAHIHISFSVRLNSFSFFYFLPFFFSLCHLFPLLTSLCCDLQCAASLVKPRALCLSSGWGGR